MFIKCRRNRTFFYKTLIFILVVLVLVLLMSEVPEYEIITSKQIRNDNIKRSDKKEVKLRTYESKPNRNLDDEFEMQLRTFKYKTIRNLDNEYEIKLREYESKIISNLGNNGTAASLENPVERKLGEKALKKVALNSILSDRIPLNRSLGDRRNKGCKIFKYNPTLTASVVIIFYNEIVSVILRTVWSVILQSPKHLLHEIVLVDDASTEEPLKGLLQYYINTRLKDYNIIMHRLNERVGLIRAKIEGAKVATGDVLIFLDSHCEATIGWMEPLLDRIEEKRNAVLTPLIDSISASNLAYFSYADSTFFQVGGFSWSGHFTWIDVQDEQDKGKLTPIRSPTMAGGLLAIEHNYFWEIGAYDDKMEGWGGENLEMSFRIWQCGGSLETIPCSRVGHIFRDFHPYTIPGKKDTHGINTARLAHVWMDEYKRLYFKYQSKYQNSPLIGDLTDRIELRKRLKCKSFKWFLDNVYPEKFIPDENAMAYGQVRNNLNMCLDDLLLHGGKTGPLGLYSCHPTLAMSQYFTMTFKRELRSENFCAEVTNEQEVQLTRCSKDKLEQFWILFKNGTIYNPSHKRCLSSEGVQYSKILKVEPCTNSDHQTWTFTYVNSSFII